MQLTQRGPASREAGPRSQPRAKLPRGQREIGDFPRFGLPAFAHRLPRLPARPAIRVGGTVAEPREIELGVLAALPRVELIADFHCVTTWSRRDVVWSGFRMRDFYEELVVPRCRPADHAGWLLMTGLDGYRTPLPLADMLADGVLLADRLAGVPLNLEHGAPIRVVAPSHYGFKAVKHLCALDFAAEMPTGSGGSRAHPRGRVAAEERGAHLPGWVYRPIFRAAIPFIRWRYRRAARRAAGLRGYG